MVGNPIKKTSEITCSWAEITLTKAKREAIASLQEQS
jgi:hypothetical protein